MMHFLNDRAGLPLLLALLVVPVGGCPHTGKPQPITPAQPPGDMLRYANKANDKAAGKVQVRVEESNVGAKKPKVSAFQFGEEHTITELKPDGSMHVTGAFINVETLGDSPREKKDGELVARALQEVKIAYDVDPRGNVTNFAAPLSDEYDAKVVSRTRLIAQWVYGADRGPLFDPAPIEVGKGWKIHAEVPIKVGDNTVCNKNWEIDFSYT